MSLFDTPLGLHAVVLVATGSYTDAAGWANDINAQHALVAVEQRVVTSISQWLPQQQQYGEALIDTGISYEGNFNLVTGRGYIVELKEPVNNFILTGTDPTISTCP
jgi:hypothetical protein